MATKLDRMLFLQGGRCFFCDEELCRADASLEHLVATANGGPDCEANCVACCKVLNGMLGSLSLKEKIRVVLNQRGRFKCPAPAAEAPFQPAVSAESKPAPIPSETDAQKLLKNLQSRKAALPKRMKSLTSTGMAYFQQTRTEQQVREAIAQLAAERWLAINGESVTYSF
jgi:hypothetical protein